MTLEQFFTDNPRVALAFSGGVDSAYLLYAAKCYCKSVTAYYVKTAFQPQFELNDAVKLAKELNADMKIINRDILVNDDIVKNGSNRCYYCKKFIFTSILEAALKDGYTTLIDGTNASDNDAERPGIKAIKELTVRSPLRESGLTKDDIRKLSKNAGIFTWNKPAYSCLATRVHTHEMLTKSILTKIEKAEEYLFMLGFSDFRVRTYHNAAILQFPKEQLQYAFNLRSDILSKLSSLFDIVTIDIKCRN